MNRHIGFFTAYQPHVELGQDGIGRLMIYILKGMLNNGDRVTILAPSWHRGEVKKLLKEYSLEKSVKIKTTRWHAPVMLLIYDLLLWNKYRNKEELPQVMEEKDSFTVLELLKKLFYRLMASYSFLVFFLFVIVTLALGIVLFPVWILILPLWLFKNWFFNKIDASSVRGGEGGTGFFSKKLKQYLSFAPRGLRSDTVVLGIMNAARASELKRMIKYVNKGDIDLWYVPSIFWKEVLKIKKKRVIVVPDLVYAEFPHLYCIDAVMQWSSQSLDRILKEKPKIVCYSNHVKERHLVQLRDVKPGSVTVIPHGVVDLSEHLRMGLPPKEIIQVYLNKHARTIPNGAFVKEFNFDEAQFIIYSSQYRYHKNIVGLLYALEKLIRRDHINLVLVLTCANYQFLFPYLEKLNLMREVIFMPKVPESVLAALNHFALLHVNPSLFEGGFPFTFNEAYSVGTPSVMADIPVTREYVDDELAKNMLFDPYDVEDIVNKIKWGMEHRDELLKMEKPLYEKFAQRTWDIVAEEYVDAMSYSYRRKLPKRKRKPWKRKRS